MYNYTFWFIRFWDCVQGKCANLWVKNTFSFFSQLILFLHTFAICTSAHIQTDWGLTGVWIRYRKYFSLLTVYIARWNESFHAPLNFNSTVAVMMNLLVGLWAIVFLHTHKEKHLQPPSCHPLQRKQFFLNKVLCIQLPEQQRAWLQLQDPLQAAADVHSLYLH